MDIASFLGFLLGVAAMLFGIITTGQLVSYYDLGSIYITIGGTIAALLISFPLKTVKNAIVAARFAFFPRKINTVKTIDSIIELAEVARRQGLLGLEEKAKGLKDTFFKNGLNTVMETNEPDRVRDILETELAFMMERHDSVIRFFEKGGAFAPGFGMVGTLIGLINMLLKLDNPGALGPSMSVALVTTFYGSVMANLIFLPIAAKLKLRSDQEVFNKRLILEGLIAIQSGDNPRMIREKLTSFIPPKERRKADTKTSKVRRTQESNLKV